MFGTTQVRPVLSTIFTSYVPVTVSVIFRRSSWSTVGSLSLSAWFRPHSFLPVGENCNDVIVLAVRFQNWVSFADALTGMNARIKAIRVAALAIACCSPECCGFILYAPERCARRVNDGGG